MHVYLRVLYWFGFDISINNTNSVSLTFHDLWQSSWCELIWLKKTIFLLLTVWKRSAGPLTLIVFQKEFTKNFRQYKNVKTVFQNDLQRHFSIRWSALQPIRREKQFWNQNYNANHFQCIRSILIIDRGRATYFLDPIIRNELKVRFIPLRNRQLVCWW